MCVVAVVTLALTCHFYLSVGPFFWTAPFRLFRESLFAYDCTGWWRKICTSRGDLFFSPGHDMRELIKERELVPRKTFFFFFERDGGRGGGRGANCCTRERDGRGRRRGQV